MTAEFREYSASVVARRSTPRTETRYLIAAFMVIVLRGFYPTETAATDGGLMLRRQEELQ